MSTTAINRSKILIDHVGSIRFTLTEGKEDKKLYAEGKIGQCGVPTANGRVYTLPVMQREINRLQERISNGSVFCAIDHPGDGKSRLADAGAIVRKLWIESDGSIHGRFEIIEECGPGQHLAALIRRGGNPGMSSRGLGSTHVNEQGHEVVGEDFRLATWDFVSDPAVSTAFPQFFTEDKAIVEQITTDALRAKFPHLVRQIEESAHEVAKNTTMDAVRSELEGEVEQAFKLSQEKLKEEIKIQVLPEILKELRDDFAVKLIKALQGMRKDCEESVRSEFASDPKVAGAKLALEQVAKLVFPFNPPADMKQILDAKDATLENINLDLSAKDKALTEAEAIAAKAISDARELGCQLFVEKALSGRADAVQLREMIGDISVIKDVKELKAKVEGVIKTADSASALAENKSKTELANQKKVSEHKLTLAKQRADKIEEEKKYLAATLEAKVNDLASRLETVIAAKDHQLDEQVRLLEAAQKKIGLLEEGLNRASTLAENLSVKKYAEERTIGHPQKKKIFESIRSGKTKSKADVNKLAEDLETAAEEPGGVSERVRRAMSKGRESIRETDRVKRESEALTEGYTPVPGFEGLEGLDVSLEQLRTLSGIDSKSK